MEFIPGVQWYLNIHKSNNVAHHINKPKNKNHIVISINVRKTFDKTQQQFMIKTLNKYAQMDMYLNIVRKIHDKSNHTTQQWKAGSFSSIRNKIRMPTLTISIQHGTGNPSHSYQTRKRIQNWEEVKLSLLAEDKLNTENPKDSIKKLIKELSKVTGYKINIHGISIH